MPFVNILKARDIAMQPDRHSTEEREAAIKSLTGSAAKNKDRQRAAADVELAKALRQYSASQLADSQRP